jgi:hypothetical protein
VAKLIQVIVTDDRRGAGVERDPIRQVTQYWTPEGRLLAEVDPYPTNPELAQERQRYDRMVDSFTRDTKRLHDAIRWALGEEGTFAERPPGKGAFWWRTELRRRAGIAPP